MQVEKLSPEQRLWLAEMGHSLLQHVDAASTKAAAADAEREQRTLWAVAAIGHVRVELLAPASKLSQQQRDLLDALLAAGSLRALAPDSAPAETAGAVCLTLPPLATLSAAERRTLWPRLRAFRRSAERESAR